jgi:O-antigen ligase
MLLNREKREQKMLSWAWFGLCIFVTSFLWSPSRDGVEGIYALAFFIPLLAVLPWRKPDLNDYGGVFTLIALAYASWSLLSSLWGSDTGFFILQWIVLAIWLTGSAWVLRHRSMPWETLWCWLIAISAVTATLNIVVFYSSHGLNDRLEGITIARAPTLVGQIYGVAALLAIVQSWRTDSFKHALLLSVAAIPALAAVGLSQSRGPLLALAIALIVGLIWLKPFRKILVMQLLAAGFLLIALFAIFPIDQALALRGASFRDQIWSFLWQEMLAEPSIFLTGVGMTQGTVIATPWGDFHHVHNAWLEILYRTGVVGLFLALLHLGYLLWQGLRTSQCHMLVLWLIYGCGCLLVDSRSLFWEIDAKWFMYWVPAGLLAATLASRRSIQQG